MHAHLLLENLLKLLSTQRPAFGQERTYQRAEALVFGELFSFARHTVTQALMVLGLTDADWSACYRLYSRGVLSPLSLTMTPSAPFQFLSRTTAAGHFRNVY